MRDRRLEQLERIAERMDHAFRIPVIGKRIGWDSILGLVPGIGDVLTLLPAGYIIHAAWGMGAPTPVLARMLANVAVDVAVGTVPVIGDIFDVVWEANSRNVRLLRRYLEETSPLQSPTVES